MNSKKRFELATTGDILLTDAQACAYLSITPRTLRLWRCTRGLPFIRISAKNLRYRKSDLEAWLYRMRVVVAA
jgi:excisionase family DNA binding protein